MNKSTMNYIFFGYIVFLSITVRPTVHIMPISHVSYKYEESITTRADVIDWRYKTENGKLYRCLYNYTKQNWIGFWELCS